jgi:hypothetical protein
MTNFVNMAGDPIADRRRERPGCLDAVRRTATRSGHVDPRLDVHPVPIKGRIATCRPHPE